MDVQEEIRFFDEFQAEHGDYDVLTEATYERLLRRFDRTIRPLPGQTCIDLGCGTGAFTRRLKRFGLALTGVDISPRNVERATQLSTGETYVTGDLRATGLPGGSADILMYSGVLHHLPGDEERLDALREGLRILKPGGALFAYDPNAHSPSMFLFRDPRSPLHSDKGKTPNEVLLSRRQLTGQLTAAGFTRVRVEGMGGITFSWVDSPIARSVLPLYNCYEHLLRIPPLGSLIGTFVVTTAWKPRPAAGAGSAPG